MDILLQLVIGIVFSWITLIIVMPIARKLSDFSLPPWQQTVPRLGVVAAATVLTQVLLVTFVNGFLGYVVGYVASVIVFFALLYKWFDIDVWAAVVIVVVSRVVQFALLAALGAMLA